MPPGIQHPQDLKLPDALKIVARFALAPHAVCSELSCDTCVFLLQGLCLWVLLHCDGKLSSFYRPPSASIAAAPMASGRDRASRPRLGPAGLPSQAPLRAPLLRPRVMPYKPAEPAARLSLEATLVAHPPEGSAFPVPRLLTSSTTKAACSMKDALTNAMNEQVSAWLVLSRRASSHSKLVAGLLLSTQANAHLARLVRMNAPSTLCSYLRMWVQWEKFAEANSTCPFEPPEFLLLDFFSLHARGRLCSAQGWIKALRFVANKLVLEVLRQLLFTPAVSAYALATETVPRRESAPLPLSFVIWLEGQVLDVLASAAHRLRCGAILACVFASLRWSDALWSSPSEIYISMGALLGSAARTKTTRRSMPWAARAAGFLSKGCSATSWGSVFFALLQRALEATKCAHPEFEPDFLLADLGPDESSPLLLAPLSRNEGLILLRRLLLRCYSGTPAEKRPDLSLIGVHSLKVTFLSFSKQLLIEEPLRLLQGHHRGSLRSMGELYGRDDVAAPLQVQEKIIKAVLAGFRPLRPHLRGACPSSPDISILSLPSAENSDCEVPPLASRPEPTMEDDSSSDSDPEAARMVVSQKCSDAADSDDSGFAMKGSLQPLPVARAGGSEFSSPVVSSGQLDSGDFQAENPALLDPSCEPSCFAPGVIDSEAEEFEFLLNTQTKVVHIARVCSASHPACQYRPVLPSDFDRPLRAACGVRGCSSVGTLQRSPEIPTGFRLCLKYGCAKDPLFEQITLDLAGEADVPAGLGSSIV